MEEHIKILLAAYNGSEYIQEQINSIIKQTYSNWELLVRDDGSMDNTVGIVSDYEKRDSRIKLVIGNNLGSAKNFNELMKLSLNEKYIMFSDQDDVWDENKIEITFQSMKQAENEYGKDTPILVYTDKTDVDCLLNNIKKVHRKYKDGFVSTLAQCQIYGCTMMLNQEMLVHSYPVAEYAYTHDYWISLCAWTYGKVIHVYKSTMKYRQHNGNVTGGMDNYLLTGKIKRWKKVNIRDHLLITQNVKFCESLTDNQEAKTYLDIVKKKGFKKIIKAIKIGLYRDHLLATARYYYNLLTY